MSNENKPEDLVGKYTINAFSKNRQIASEVFDEFLKKHYMAGFFEVNVSLGKQLIKDYEKLTGEKVSFTGWITKCVSEAVRQFPEANVFRWGKNKVIQFEDIDIILMVERQLPDKVIAVPHPIRKSQTKDLLTISREIRSAQKAPVSEEEQLLEQGWKVRLYNLIPKFIRRRLIARMVKDPFYVKKQGGLILITAVGMFTNTRLWVGLSGGITSLNIALGGVAKRLVEQNGEILEQEFMQITAMLDHDVLDGAPAARLQAKLVDLIETGYGLRELLTSNEN
jgi:pyruvate/2-oxoglutarate dehydrogenase complex dihydrolipoamide acyltransferase (E2) component